jgi:hypothetical protein
MSIVYDDALFRAQCPEFADETKYPPALIQMYWDQATCIVSNEDYGPLMGDCRALGLNLLTAHLLKISQNIMKGKQGGYVVSSTIDKISVQRLAPPSVSEFDWWLNQTPYGQQLLVMLEVHTVGGFSFGGLPERSAFRKVNGVF